MRYAETDQMGVVYYANYLVWMEVGRVELCKACGFNYRDMEIDDGIFLAVAEANCRYRHPARYDDEVIVRTWIENANTRMVTFAYEMRRASDDRRLATGYTATSSFRAPCAPHTCPRNTTPYSASPSPPRPSCRRVNRAATVRESAFSIQAASDERSTALSRSVPCLA